MSKVINSIKGKISYYKIQESKTTKRFIREMKRLDRDDIIRIQERIVAYEEIVAMIEKEGI